ncbi:amino acid ABC transporter ATP-binding protein, partial [Ralstonia pseudosolanacearum]
MIEIRELQKHFGEHHVLRGVSLRVDKGEVVCLIGPSGSGKSTVLRCINGLESYDGGEIRAFGERVDRDGKAIHTLRSRMGMVFQRFNLFPHRSVLENVMEGPVYVKGERPDAARAKAMALLEKVGLAAKAQAYPAQLSGGQQQRVAIARALAMEPEAMLFDEPTSAL